MKKSGTNIEWPHTGRLPLAQGKPTRVLITFAVSSFTQGQASSGLLAKHIQTLVKCVLCYLVHTWEGILGSPGNSKIRKLNIDVALIIF